MQESSRDQITMPKMINRTAKYFTNINWVIKTSDDIGLQWRKNSMWDRMVGKWDFQEYLKRESANSCIQTSFINWYLLGTGY